MSTRILILTEKFEQGGLETYILGQSRVLSRLGSEVMLATGSTGAHIPQGAFAAQLTDLALGPNTSLSELRSTLGRLQEFAQRYRPTLIHAHPVHSYNVALLLAQELRLPLVITMHGPWSLEGVVGQVPDLLFKIGVLQHASVIFCVSQEVAMLCRAAGGTGVLLPNSVASRGMVTLAQYNQKKWMWAGRLDAEKIPGLLDLLQKMRGLGCELDIYGDGPDKAKVERYALDDPKIGSIAHLKGWYNSLDQVYPKYGVVAGMGRVLVEAGAAGAQCLLVGYDGVKGFLEPSNVGRAAYSNFSGRGLESMDTQQFVSLLHAMEADRPRFNLSGWVNDQRNEEIIWRRYHERVVDLPPIDCSLAADALETIRFHGSPTAPAWSNATTRTIVAGLSDSVGCPVTRDIVWKTRRSVVEEAIRLVELPMAQQQGRIDALQERIVELTSERDRAVHETAAMRTEAQLATAARDAALESVHVSNVELLRLTEERNSATELAGARHLRAELLLSERDAAADKLRIALAELEDIRRTRDSAVAAAEAAHAELEGARTELEDVCRTRDSAVAAAEAARAIFKEARAQLEGVRAELQDVGRMRDTAVAATEAVCAELDSARQERDAAAAAVEEARVELDAARRSLRDVSRERDAAVAAARSEALLECEQLLRKKLDDLRKIAACDEEVFRKHLAEWRSRQDGVVETARAAIHAIEDVLSVALAPAA